MALETQIEVFKEMLIEHDKMKDHEWTLKRLQGYYNAYQLAVEQGITDTRGLVLQINKLSIALKKDIGAESFEKWRNNLEIIKRLQGDLVKDTPEDKKKRDLEKLLAMSVIEAEQNKIRWMKE